MTKSTMVLTGVAVAALMAVGAYAQDAAKPAPPADAGMRGAMAFAKMDANGDGKVSLEEYQAAMAEMAKVRFAAMDADKDGSVTEAEMQAGRSRRGGPGMGRPDGAARPGRGGQRGGDGQGGDKGE